MRGFRVQMDQARAVALTLAGWGCENRTTRITATPTTTCGSHTLGASVEKPKIQGESARNRLATMSKTRWTGIGMKPKGPHSYFVNRL